MQEVLFIVIIIVLFLLGVIVLPQFMLRRAIRQVISIFRQNGATNKNSAKFIGDMGIKPQGMFSLRFGLRDYKYYAVQALMKHEIIQDVGDGKMYLLEDKLHSVNL